MDAYDAAARAFAKCHSRSPEKNQACAPFIAGQYLKAAGMPSDEVEVSMEFIHRLLDEWYQRKATQPDWMPIRSDYMADIGEDGSTTIDIGETE
jgi:hypothetical protein